jgi:hypothetical protein
MISGSEDGLLLPESDKVVRAGTGGERGGVLRDAGLRGEAQRGLRGGVEVLVDSVLTGSGGCWRELGELDLLGILGGRRGVAANTSP